MVKIAFASGIHGEFGLGNSLPWGAPLKGDMEQFKAFTDGCILVMGHATFESLPTKLRNLTHVVITTDNHVRTKDGSKADAWMVPDLSVDDMLQTLYNWMGDSDYCIIGGAKLIEAFAPHADEILHTSIYVGIDPLDEVLEHDIKINLESVLITKPYDRFSAIIAYGNERCYGYSTRIYKR